MPESMEMEHPIVSPAMATAPREERQNLLTSPSRNPKFVSDGAGRILKSAYHGTAMPELSLSSAANIAEIVGASTIVTGVVFGWVQLRQYRIQQRDSIAQSLMQTFYSRDLAAAIALLQSVPDDISLAALRAKGREYEEAAVTVTTSFETMGILIFKGIAPLDLVVDLAGGVIATMNRKLGRVQEELRLEQKQPSWGEWFTWLGDQVERVKTKEPPAHIRHRDWRG